MSTLHFQIHVPEHKLDRLREKLALSDYPDDVLVSSENDWSRGPPVAEIKRLAKVWQTSYNWRKVEARLNELPQYITSVEVDNFGVYNIHHIHKQSTRTNAIPLLFLHGWPGSFLEVTKILNELVEGDGDNPTFHVVAPSLIDFGFSSASGSKSFQIEQHAEAYDKLMAKLGYSQYVIQAGDIGYLVTRFIAKKHGSSRLRAYHTNTPAPIQPDPKSYPQLHAQLLSTPLTESEEKGLARADHFAKEGFGYYKQQSTKPLTIGYSLRDSPIGLLAWLYEKMRDWSDNYSWTDNEILTWVSIYYFSTPGPDATSNIYYAMEHREQPAFEAAASYIDVPFGVTRFSNDLVLLPKLWNQSLGPVVFESEHQTGGHFAAWETPDAIIQDLRRMFGKDGGAHSIVQSMVLSSNTGVMPDESIPEGTPALPDENTPEGIAARRKIFHDLESADLVTLGPCPSHLHQTTFDIHLSDGFVSRTILVHPAKTTTDSSKACPLIIYIHGGSFTYCTPSFVLSPSRAFAEIFGAVVACPTYKLAPENPFPASVHSAWESVSWLSAAVNLNSGPLEGTGVHVDPALGFVLAGTSAGGNLAANIAGIAAAVRSGRDDLAIGLPEIGPRITGLFVSVPKLLHEEIVPERYAAAFRSRQENADAPVIDSKALRNSDLRLRPDVRSPWFSPVNLDLLGFRDEHPKKVYVQCGELDILRDDAVIYEQILRDGGISETRIDVLKEHDHTAWVSFPSPQCHSQEIKEKTLDGMAWLLGKSWDRKRPLPY